MHQPVALRVKSLISEAQVQVGERGRVAKLEQASERVSETLESNERTKTELKFSAWIVVAVAVFATTAASSLI